MYTHYIHYSCDFKRKFVKSNGFIITHQVSLLLIMSTPGNSTCTHGWCLCKTLNPSSANKITHQECGRPSIMWQFRVIWATGCSCYRYMCNVWDVEANMRVHKTIQLLMQFGQRVSL